MTTHHNPPPRSFARRPWERPPSPQLQPPAPITADTGQHEDGTSLERPTQAIPTTSVEAPDISVPSTSEQPPAMVAAPSAAGLDPVVAQPPAPLRPPSPTIRPPRQPRRRGSRRGLLIAVTVFVVVVAASVGAGVWALQSMSSSTSTPAASAIPSAPVQVIDSIATQPSSPPTADPADPCPETTTGAVTTGDDQGDVVGGAAVIKRFNFAYYVWRSGAKAREVVAPNALVGTVQQLDDGIRSIPEGSTFCLSITDRGEGLWAVQLTQNTPNPADRKVWHQLVQTVDSQGRTWIVSIDTDKRKGQ